MSNTMNEVPITVCKHACMKLDSLISDVAEIRESLPNESGAREYLETVTELLASIEGNISNLARSGYTSDDEFITCFVDESIDMDEIDEFPEDCPDDVMDEII